MKTYNYDKLYKKIIINSNCQATEKEKVIYRTLMHNPNSFGYDRINDPEHIGDYISNIPEYKDISLEEAIEDSTEQLFQISGNKAPTLLLSGGIDSTLVFYALLLKNKPFNVINDGSLIIENQNLFQHFLHNDFPNVNFYKSSKTTCRELAHDPHVLLVTGEIGDQIMGSMITMNFSYEERMMNLTNAIKIDLFKILNKSQLYKDDNFTKACVDYYQNAVTWLNKTNDTCTISEFLWAVNFIYKYFLVIYRLYACDLVQHGPNKNTYHFFDTEKFQQYAMSHYEKNCAYTKPYEYKQEYKDWIYTQNGDEEYRKYKLKVPSLKISSYWTNRDLVMQ